MAKKENKSREKRAVRPLFSSKTCAGGRFAFIITVMEIKLRDSEKLEDLQAGGLMIIQDSGEYRFTSDAVLLANSVRAKKGDLVIDLGTGSGIIALLVAYKRRPGRVIAVELQDRLADMAARSVKYNGMQDTIEVVCRPMQTFAAEYKGRKADVVVCNPPYIKQGCGEAQEKESLRLCRHEEAVTLDEICRAAGRLLKSGGRFYIVHKAPRCADVFECMTRHSITPKEITTVCAREGDAPYLVIVCGRKDGGEGLLWHKPIVVYDKDGNFTPTIKQLYGEKDV